jgi:hypothetical protein
MGPVGSQGPMGPVGQPGIAGQPVSTANKFVNYVEI